ncbi:MAG: hypothetical protein WC523_01385 [Patescibacteria group bacterium]|jgi:hypothetical protein
MEKTLILNPAVVYRKKNGIYAVYLDFNYFFFSGPASDLIDGLLLALAAGESLNSFPSDFLAYLVSKKIITEEQKP